MAKKKVIWLVHSFLFIFNDGVTVVSSFQSSKS